MVVASIVHVWLLLLLFVSIVHICCAQSSPNETLSSNDNATATTTTTNTTYYYTMLRNVSDLPGPSMSFPVKLDYGTLQFDFKTLVTKALVLYQDSEYGSDFISMSIQNGKLHVSFFDGIKTREASPVVDRRCNDFQWHTVRITRNETITTVTLDGNYTRMISTPNARKPKFTTDLQIGGFTPESYENTNTIANLESLKLFVGGTDNRRGFFNACVRNIKFGEHGTSSIKHIEDIPLQRYYVQEGEDCHLTYCDVLEPICMNNGRCAPNSEEGNSTVTCDCTGTGYDGTHCTEDINECQAQMNSSVCHEDALCTNIKGSYLCKCKQGYNGDGKINCKEIKKCETFKTMCHANARCIDVGDTYSCNCAAGYVGDGTANCTDINECMTGQPGVCHNQASCINTMGSYSCQCLPGYSGDGAQNCSDINECRTNQNDCDERAICANTDGSYSCQCQPGYTGDGKNCTDIDECLNDTTVCHEKANCTNTLGSFTCECKISYFGDGRSLCFGNHCKTLPCFPGVDCTLTNTGFACGSCPKHFSGDGEDCALEEKSEMVLFNSSMTLTNATWDDGLNNKSSMVYKTLSHSVTKAISKAYSKHDDFAYVLITGFRQGSVVVDFKLIFSKQIEDPFEPLLEYLEKTNFGMINSTIDANKGGEESDEDNEIGGLKKSIFIGIIIAILVLLIVVVAILICVSRKRRQKSATITEKEIELLDG